MVAKRKSLHDEILELQSGRFATDNVIDSTRANALNDLLFNGKISSGSNERFSSVADFTISKSTKHSGGRRVKVLCPAFDQLNKRADFAISFLSDWWITGTVSRVLERTVNDKYYTNAEQVARYGCACGVESTIALSNLQQFVSYKNDANVQQVIVEIDSSSLKSLGCGEAGTVVYYTFPADKVYRLSAGVSPDRAEVSAINTSLLEPFMEGLLQKYYKDEDLLIPEDQGAIEDGEATTQQPDADDSPISAVELAAIRGLPNAVVLPFRQGFIAERNLHEHHSRQFVLLTADYAQVELRLLAHFSSDKNLCAAISSGKDVFRTIAAEWHGIEGTEVSSKTRDHVKRVCYAVIYGAGAKLVAEQCGIPADAAVSLMNDFLKKFSGIKSFIANCKRLCRQRGYVETLLGRRRALPDIKSSVQNKKARAERQAVNTLCQGSAADLIKVCFYLLFRTRLIKI